MRWGDLLGIALSALAQQKVRTTLSLLGVAIGAFALALSLSVGQGVHAAILRQLRRNDQLRKIIVWPNSEAEESQVPAEALKVEGAMSDARRARLRKAIVQRWRRDHFTRPKALLTAERLHSLAALEHVRSVTPSLHQQGRAVFEGNSVEVAMASAPPGDKSVSKRIVAGKAFATESDRSVLVHEYLLYRWGFVTEQDVRKVLGRTIRLEYRTGKSARVPILTWLSAWKVEPDAPENKVADRLLRRLPPMLAAMPMSDEERRIAMLLLQGLLPPDDPVQEPPIVAEFTIAGVIRQTTDDDPSFPLDAGWWARDADILIPTRTAQKFFFRSPENAQNGAQMATIAVDGEEDVRRVVKVVKALGYTESSLVEVIEQFRWNVLLITFAVAFIAAVTLVVAALGITNTMIMSVLERTREIGVMKAVGARDRQIQLIFLVEGLLIGLSGGALGPLLSWLAALPGEAIARAIITRQTHSPFDETVFVFPMSVTLGVPALACLITILAAVYPARRAVRVDPVTSLRHE